MCGRDSQFYTWKEIHAFYSGIPLKTPAADPTPNYNRAPTQSGWVFAADGDGATAHEMRWGLLPSWAKDGKMAYSTINARVETVDTKPTFRTAWKQRRAIVPSSGYFEWQKTGSTKQPYFIHNAAGPVLFFGGLWEERRDLLTYSIVTRPADPAIEHLHDRMPLILPGELVRDWLYGTPDQAMEIAQSAPEPPLEFYPVDRAVGNVRNTGAQLVEPIGPPPLF